MWKHTPVTPELKRWRQEDSEFKDSLDQKTTTVANKIVSSEIDFFLLKKENNMVILNLSIGSPHGLAVPL